MYDDKTECTTHQSGTVYDDKTEWTTHQIRLNVQLTKSALGDDKIEWTTEQSGTVR